MTIPLGGKRGFPAIYPRPGVEPEKDPFEPVICKVNGMLFGNKDYIQNILFRLRFFLVLRLEKAVKILHRCMRK